MFFTPKYLKQAKLLNKGVKKFLHYKDDILPRQRLDEIENMRLDLVTAIKAKDREKVEKQGNLLLGACEQAQPSSSNSSWLRENVEVFFVAIVIALGVRTYIVQPFRIPTGSMQPTLNGKIATPVQEWGEADASGKTIKKPNPIFRVADFLIRGRTYVDLVAKKDGLLREKDPITEGTVMKFFPYTTIHYADGDKQRVFCPRDKAVRDFGLSQSIGAQIGYGSADPGSPLLSKAMRPQVKEGQVLARGYLQTGDQVLVNKFAYHFRKPNRGEVFVFKTTGIQGIERQVNFDPRFGSQHYIKRLVGVPGDQVQVGQDRKLYIDGEEAQEKYIRRVFSMEGEYQTGYTRDSRMPNNDVKLNDVYGLRQYWAMGDNSASSSDSRAWGAVPEDNLVGVGFMVYWPFGSHWGLIR